LGERGIVQRGKKGFTGGGPVCFARGGGGRPPKPIKKLPPRMGFQKASRTQSFNGGAITGGVHVGRPAPAGAGGEGARGAETRVFVRYGPNPRSCRMAGLKFPERWKPPPFPSHGALGTKFQWGGGLVWGPCGNSKRPDRGFGGQRWFSNCCPPPRGAVKSFPNRSGLAGAGPFSRAEGCADRRIAFRRVFFCGPPPV